MNFNEILKMREKTWVNYSMQRGNQTKIEHIGHFIMGVNLLIGTTFENAKNIVLKNKCSLVL